MAVPCQSISRPRSAGSSIGSNCCSSKSRRWRLSGTRCLRAKSRAARAGGHVTGFQWHRARIHRGLWSEGLFRTSTIGAKLLPMQGWRRRLGKVDRRSRAGVSKAGNPRLRTTLFNSPGYGCAISRNPRWLCGFKERVARNGGRHKKTTVVALARKLLVALWKYVTAGVVIEGAVMKTA